MNKINKRIFAHLRSHMFMEIIPLVFLVVALATASPSELYSGLETIILSPSRLVTDYITLAGIGPAFFNAFLVTTVAIAICYISKVEPSGPIFSAIFIIAGFSFFGKNILNIWPIYLGSFIYAKRNSLPYKRVILVTMFATCAGPIVSSIIFDLGFDYIISIPVAILVGTFLGFVAVPISSHAILFHNGYNLYNVGFGLGVLSIIFASILQMVNPELTVSTHETIVHTKEMYYILYFICLVYLIIGFVNTDDFKIQYKKILARTGRAVTSFPHLAGKGPTMVNVAFCGLFMTTWALVFSVEMTGLVFGGIITVMGFAAFGKHPRNIIPIVVGGTILTLLVDGWDITQTKFALPIIFSTGLAPIAGEYGIIAGLVTGALHLNLAIFMSGVNLGLVLYYNGLIAGFVAGMLEPVLSAAKERRRYR